jgi:hypothetical protein
MQGGRIVVPTPGVVSKPLLAGGVELVVLVPLVVSGVELIEPALDDGIDDEAVPIVEPGVVGLVPEVPSELGVELPIVPADPIELGEETELPARPAPLLPKPVVPVPMPDVEVLVPAGELAVGDELVVPGTLAPAPGMPVVDPGTPTFPPGTVDEIGGFEAAAPSVPDVGVHGRDPIG